MKILNTLILLPLLLTGLFASQKLQQQGEVFVNGKKLAKNGIIKVGDLIETKKNSKIRFNIGANAFAAKGNSKFKIEENAKTKTLNVIAGGVLAVFRKDNKNHGVRTPNMTAGIRGTGIYTEVRDGKSYFCTCYGETSLKTDKEEVLLSADHHNMVWVKGSEIKMASDMVGHDDSELRELEALVGRIPDFDK